MKYRLTVATPLLVGDGQKLSPIDYMVWKDQVNVLDQKRIFRLLAKGPRLEGYLGQLRKAEKLDFASWGGFAQNFAGRRIPFEHASSTAVWEQAHAEHLHIPTFCAGPRGAYLPGSAVKGALRTAVSFTRWNPGVIREIGARMTGDRPLRKPGEAAELMTLGSSATDPMRVISAADSAVTPVTSFKIYLLRVAALNSKVPGKFELSWKPAATFAEMAVAGTEFSGEFHENAFLKQPEIARQLHWRESIGISYLLQCANKYAAQLLVLQKQYANQAGLTRVKQSLETLEAKLAEVTQRGNACLLNLGWGGGFLGKTAFLDTEEAEYRKLLRELPYYSRAIRTGLPFPKTRRVIFLENQPAALPGWVVFEV